jgi:RNA polymerase sigma factor (sigma-70 family)
VDEAHDAIHLVLRHEYGRLVATLLRSFGAHRLALVEDGLSQALLEATTNWRARGVPPNARAWLHRAARNRIIDELRRSGRSEPLEGGRPGELEVAIEPETEAALANDVHDDELRALFACTEPSIPLASRVVFALRTLCGFSTREIARRLVTTEENVQKRWERAREGMRAVDLAKDVAPQELPERADAVLRMIYVMFTEGYFASGGESVLRLELCREAIRLARLVAEHPRYTSGAAWAAVALMHLHHARRDARADAEGQPVLLEDQDRGLYRRDELALALEALRLAERGGVSSKYHFEAAIAAEHAFAPSFAEIRWPRIVALYDRLAQVDPSPLHTLHAAIAVSYAEGPEAAFARLDAMRPPTWLSASHLWLATYADLHRRLGHVEEARGFYEKAIALAPAFERGVLERRLRSQGVWGG